MIKCERGRDGKASLLLVAFCAGKCVTYTRFPVRQLGGSVVVCLRGQAELRKLEIFPTLVGV